MKKTKVRTAMNIYEAFEKSVGKKGEVFKDVLASKTIKNRGYRPSTGRMTNLTGRVKNIRQTSRSQIVKEFTKERLQQARAGALESILSDDKFKNYDKEALEKIVKETAAKYKEISQEKNGTLEVSTDFLKRTIDMYQIDEKDAHNIIARTSKAMRDATKESINQKHLMPFMEAVEEMSLKGLNKRTRDNEFINRIGKRFGIENLDDKLLRSHKATLGELLQDDNLKKLGIDPEEFTENIKNRIKLRGHEKDHIINSRIMPHSFYVIYARLL